MTQNIIGDGKGFHGHGFTFSAANRDQMTEKMTAETQDVLVVGGGVNGAVSAAATAMAGLKTVLVDSGDFAAMTSHSSSNLIWGGIKYLENFEFGLVSKLCQSRNRLMKNFPENVREIRFCIAHERGFRFPLWFLYCGTWLYKFIGRLRTRSPKWHRLSQLSVVEPMLNPDILDGALEYSDAYLPENDSRFVLAFIKKAFSNGALPLNYVHLVSAVFEGGVWSCQLEDKVTGRSFNVKARHLINAAGPYVDTVNSGMGVVSECRHVFSKGVHLILPRLTKAHHIITFFANDGRLFFVIPMGDRSCVGTTDTRVESPECAVTEEDRDFILSNINHILNPSKPFRKEDIIAERCGVRPLAVKESSGGKGDWFQLSREHRLTFSKNENHMSIFGGKLTDCLNIGEEVVEMLKDEFGLDIQTPDLDKLGEPPANKRQLFLEKASALGMDEKTPDWALEPISLRLWRRYGDHADQILELLAKDPSLLSPITDRVELYRIEALLSAEHEMVVRPEDFIMRRTLAGFTHPEIHQSPAIAELFP